MKENHARTVLKALTYRLSSTILTIAIFYWFSNQDISVALQAGIMEVVVKMGFYYFHERSWEKVQWGRRVIAG